MIHHQVGVFETHRRRIGNGDGGVVKPERALKAAFAGVADSAIHRAAELQFGRKLRAHIARQLHQRTRGEMVPVDAHSPVRLRKIIGDAEAHGERQRNVARGVRFQIDLLLDEIELAANIERQARCPSWAADPSGVRRRYSDGRRCRCGLRGRPGAGAPTRRRGCRRARRASASVSSSRPVSQMSRFRSTRSGCTYQRPLSVNAPRPVAGRSVRASCAEQSTSHPRPMATGRRDIEIGFGEIEGRLIVAEFEIDAAVADVNRRELAHHRRVHHGGEVPAPPFRRGSGFGEIDAGVFQADGGDDELAEEQAPRLGRTSRAPT